MMFSQIYIFVSFYFNKQNIKKWNIARAILEQSLNNFFKFQAKQGN